MAGRKIRKKLEFYPWYLHLFWNFIFHDCLDSQYCDAERGCDSSEKSTVRQTGRTELPDMFQRSKAAEE